MSKQHRLFRSTIYEENKKYTFLCTLSNISDGYLPLTWIIYNNAFKNCEKCIQIRISIGPPDELAADADGEAEDVDGTGVFRCR